MNVKFESHNNKNNNNNDNASMSCYQNLID